MKQGLPLNKVKIYCWKRITVMTGKAAELLIIYIKEMIISFALGVGKLWFQTIAGVINRGIRRNLMYRQRYEVRSVMCKAAYNVRFQLL